MSARKLGLKEGGTLLLVHPPAGWTTPVLPPGATCGVADHDDRETVDHLTAVLAFYVEAAAYRGEIAGFSRRIFPDAALWVAWPRRATGHVSDLTDNVVRAAALPLGLVDNKVAAIDEDWSGLRLVWRLDRRAGPLP